tara:strand:+ start:413 stop:550 length:138 start_codon:yes stop_codon:yes gene_type:complete
VFAVSLFYLVGFLDALYPEPGAKERDDSHENECYQLVNIHILKFS